MATSDRSARRHRGIAGTFTERVLGTEDWDAPTPVDGWVARDVVRHLTEWFPAFLAAGTGIELVAGPAVDDDPRAVYWRQERNGMWMRVAILLKIFRADGVVRDFDITALN